MKRPLRLLVSLSSASVLLGFQMIMPPAPVLAQATARLCATPGRDGNPGALGGVVNTYYPGVGSVAAGATALTVGAPTGGPPIQAGDLLLIIQMQGAVFNSTNTAAYGNGTPGDVAPNPAVLPVVPPGPPQQANTAASGFTGVPIAGNYEFVVATGAVTGGNLPIQGAAGGGLINSYVSAAATATQGQQTYQVIRVPQYTTATLGNATAARWNGSTGGVLAYDVTGNLDLTGTNNVSGLGFRGGGGRQLSGAAASNNDFVTLSTIDTNGSKAEGIAGTPRFLFDSATGTIVDNGVEGYPNGSYGRGAPANAGGGSTDGNPNSNDQNSGGGGGGNGGFGGIGGRAWNPGFTATGVLGFATGGFGGDRYPATISRIVMGGGGGAGTTNNATSTTPGLAADGRASSGAAGGGIVIIRTNTVSGTGVINANGANAPDVANDGAGGGGAGGSIVVQALSNNLAGLTINANGGNGGNPVFADPHGPGGGGGGGVIFASPGATAFSRLGGVNGFTGAAGNVTLDAQAGEGIIAPITIGTVPGASSGALCQQVPQQADLKLRKTVNSPSVTVGQNVTYTVTLSNLGPADATNVAVTDRLPAGLTFVSATPSQGTYAPATGVWTVGTVPVNGSATLQVTATVTTTDPIANTAQVTASDQPDPNSTPGNNNANEDDQATATIGGPNFRLVKRITRVSRAGAITNFNTFVDDPGDGNDNAAGWAQLPPVGVVNTDPANPLRSGDEVEYTVYFLADGNTPVTAANVCDPIPTGTTFVPNSLQIQRPLESAIAGGAFFPPLAPLPPDNSCASQTNTNGSTIFDVGNVSNTAGSNAGFVRFRVRIN